MSNYELTKRRMQTEFLKYSQDEMIKKFGLTADDEYIYIRMLSALFRTDRKTGVVAHLENDVWSEAGFHETMTIYDIFCYSKPDCRLSGEFVNMHALSSVHTSSAPVGDGYYRRYEELFDGKNELLEKACHTLGGKKANAKGDVCFEMPLFDFLPVQLRFWNSDDEFPANLQLFWDKNSIQFMHFETVWYAVSYLLDRVSEEIKNA